MRPIFSGAVLTGATFIEKSGNVGIGTINPGAKLEVIGQIKITGGSPADGKILTSDENGLASWKAVSDLIPGGGNLPPGTNSQTLRHDGAKWVASGFLLNDGKGVGIGTVPDPAYSLTVNGKVKINDLLDAASITLGGESRKTWPNFITYTCEEGDWGKNAGATGYCFNNKGTYRNLSPPPGATCGDNDGCSDLMSLWNNPSNCPAGYEIHETYCTGDCGPDNEGITVCKRSSGVNR